MCRKIEFDYLVEALENEAEYRFKIMRHVFFSIRERDPLHLSFILKCIYD